MSGCSHPHGDHIEGWWICGKCWEKLPERPSHIVIDLGVIEGDIPRPQHVVHARFSGGREGLLGAFIRAVAARLMVLTQGQMQRTEAIDYAIELIRWFEEEFGNEEFDWSTHGAWEIADEDVQYWDQDTQGANT